MTKLKLAADFPEVSHADWVEQAKATIKSETIDTLVSRTLDEIAIQPIYPAPETAFPVISNLRETESAPWVIVQRADIPDIAAANKQILEDLLNGASGISLVLPGAVTAGRYGVPVQTVEDIKKLTKEVELDLISVRLDAGPGGRQIGQKLLQVYRDRNLDLSRCDLNFGLDPIANFAISGATAQEVDLADKMAKFLTGTQKAGHTGKVFCGDGRIYHESGGSHGQELGFAIASVVQQLRLLESAGVGMNSIWQHFGLMLSADADQFLTIAKLRAAHLVWQRLQEVVDVEPTPLNLDVETSLAMMSQCEPYVNMLRTTSATFAAGVGGAQSISLLPFTSALGVADGFARRIARNGQIILQEESSIGRVGDAAAGSGYIEAMSNEIAEKAWGILQLVEKQGGMIEALSDGLVQKLIDKSAQASRTAVNNRKQVLIGVSEFANLEAMPIKTLDFKPLTKPSWPAGEINCQPLIATSLAQPFEALRDRAKAMSEKPIVKLVTIGNQAEFAARTTWISNLFAAGGIATDTTTEKCKIACICSTDALYGEQAISIFQQLKNDGIVTVFIAGHPKHLSSALVEQLKQNGVDGFIYAGCDVLQLLQQTLERLEG